MVAVALAFAVLEIGGSASDVGLVLAAGVFPLVGSVLVGGVVAGRVLDQAAATRAGAGSTGHATQALTLAPMIADVITGLAITHATAICTSDMPASAAMGRSSSTEANTPSFQ